MGFIHAAALLDFCSHLFHTVFITDGRLSYIDQKYLNELKQKYIKTHQKEWHPNLSKNSRVLQQENFPLT